MEVCQKEQACGRAAWAWGSGPDHWIADVPVDNFGGCGQPARIVNICSVNDVPWSLTLPVTILLQAMMHSELVVAARVAGPAAMTAISRPFYNAAAPWPRIAFTARGGKCLHNKACSAVDTNKCSPMEYHSHKELEACMAEGGMVLCHTCRADNGF